MRARLEGQPVREGAAARTRAGEFDEETGRSLLNWPPSPVVEYRRMRLDVFIADMNTAKLEGAVTYTVVPVGKDLWELTLDVGTRESMTIGQVDADVIQETPVGADGRPSVAGGMPAGATFSRDEKTLTIRFGTPIPVGRVATIQIGYTLVDPAEGMTWTPEGAAWPGRPAQLHTQGEPQSNHFWFPCHDFPNARLATEIVATVPKGYLVSSNGRLVSRTSSPSRAGYETFDWLQEQPHAAYLVTLVVGKFDVVDVTTGKVPMPVYAPVGKGDQVKQTYGRTPEMIAVFERATGQAYPWDKYAQVLVHDFGSGGMENTSATTMYDGAILDRTALQDGDLDGLISHELAHQWFGDLITCNSWEHIWLNEGFATYMSSLWFEKRDGPATPTNDAYQAGIWGNFHGVIARDKADAPYQPAMCSKQYAHPWEAFGRAANPYPKGASILHMLRMKLGDETFFRGLALYVQRTRGRTVETSDFRKAMEAVSGLSLQRFFDQWCFHPGVPRLAVKPVWESAAGQLTVTIEQTQHIDGYNPAFDVEVPVWVQGAGGKAGTGSWMRVRMDQKSASISVSMDGPPEFVAVDPSMVTLAEYQVEQSPAAWVAQLKGGPTMASRLGALEAINSLPAEALPDGALRTMAELARDARASHMLREHAVATLGRLHARDQLAAMTGPGWPEDARVRRAVVEQLAAIGASPKTGTDEAIVGLIADRGRHDPSYGVRSEAVRAMGSARAPASMGVIAEALGSESQRDQVRQAALDALGALDAPEGLEQAAAFTRVGVMPRTRPGAIAAVVKLAHHDPDKALSTLTALLDDPERRTVRSAGEALVRLADARALPALEQFAARATGETARTESAKWVAELKAKTSQAPAPATPAGAGATEPAPIARWFPITRIEDWYQPDEREKAYGQTADYFATHDLVVELREGQFYILCWNTPERIVDEKSGKWSLEQTAVSKDPAGSPMIEVSLDEGGGALVGALTEKCVGRFMAIVVEGSVVRAPKIQTKINRRMMLTGPFDADSAGALALKVARPGAVSFRVPVIPGELPEEPVLREGFRKTGK